MISTGIRTIAPALIPNLVFYKSITLTRFPAMFSTYSFPSVKANADGPSSLSGGFGVKLPILVPFKSKTSTASKCVLDAYNRSAV